MNVVHHWLQRFDRHEFIVVAVETADDVFGLFLGGGQRRRDESPLSCSR